MKKSISDEIEVSQKGEAMSADNGAFPYYLTELSNNIFDIGNGNHH